MRLYIVDGFNLIPALIDSLFTKRGLILGENFSLLLTRRLLKFVVSILFKSGIFRDAYEHLNVIRHLKTITAYQDRTDIFFRIEEALNQRYRFSEIERHAPDYAMACKHYSASYVRHLLLLPFVIRELSVQASPSDFTIRGLPPDVLFFYEEYFGEKPLCDVSLEFELLHVVSSVNALHVLLVSLTWIAVKVRVFPAAQQRRPLGADYTNSHDRRGFRLVEAISDRTSDVVFVFRNRARMKSDRSFISRFDVACMGDGHFPVVLGLRTMAEAVTGWWRLTRWAFGLSNPLFLEIVLLPIRRMRFRALFQKFHFDNFMSRDDYNPEHCLRSAELRAVGTRSLGIMHGMALEEIVQPSMRYIDFDFYYMFGYGQYLTYYKDRFGKGTVARAIGAWGMTPEQLARLGGARPPNMIYFGRGGPREGIILDSLFAAARHFPDRTFFIKLKNGMFRYSSEILDRFEALPANVIYVDPNDDTYELMLHARYAIGSATTAICEAIHYGLTVFAFDLYPDWHFYLREFPGLCVKSADELIERIESIEAGTTVYPRHLYKDLIEFSVPDPFALIREDMGLAPKNICPPAASRANRKATGLSI